MAAVLEGVNSGPDAELAATYVRWMAARQIAGGAAYLDLNVDEISPDVEGRLEAMAWLVGVVGPVTTVPLSIDSSDSAVMTVGLDLYDPAWAGGASPLLNSAAADRVDVLEMAAQRGNPVVLSSTGATMPSDTEERLVRAEEMIQMALGHGLALADLHVDPLVIPIGVDALAGVAYLDAVRALRERLRTGDPHHGRCLQRVVRDAGSPPHQRRLPRPVRAGRAGQRDHRPGRGRRGARDRSGP